jgi:hypothetical protein
MGAWAVSSELKLLRENKGDSQAIDMLSCAVLNMALRAFSKIEESSSSKIFKRCFWAAFNRDGCKLNALYAFFTSIFTTLTCTKVSSIFSMNPSILTRRQNILFENRKNWYQDYDG